MIFGRRFDGATIQQPQVRLGFVPDDVIPEGRQLSRHVLSVRVVVSASPRLDVDALSSGYNTCVDGSVCRRVGVFVDQVFVFLAYFWQDLSLRVNAVGA